MSPDTTYEDLDPTAAEIIRRKASRLVGRAGFTEPDREDLEQELTLAVLRALPFFDEQRACLRTFLSRVVDNSAAKIVRHRTAVKRDYRRLAHPRGKLYCA